MLDSPASARSSSSLRSAPRSALLIWATPTVAFMASGFGLLGVRRLERHWQVLGLAEASILKLDALLRGYRTRCRADRGPARDTSAIS